MKELQVATLAKTRHLVELKSISTGRVIEIILTIGVKCVLVLWPTQSRRAPLNTITASYPTDIVAMDIPGPFPERMSRITVIFWWLLTILLGGWRHFQSNPEAGIIVNKVVDEVFMHFGVPIYSASRPGSLSVSLWQNLVNFWAFRRQGQHPSIHSQMAWWRGLLEHYLICFSSL